MPDCRYCDQSFETEDAYLEHLEETHPGELGPIDRRRLGGSGGFDVDIGPIALLLVIGVSVAIVAYVVFFSGGGSSAPAGTVAITPTGVGTAHFHGTIDVIIAGDRLDFARDRYQLQDRAFHFEGGEGSRWHAHAQRITIEYAMATLGIQVTSDSVTVDGTTYRDGASGTTVIVEANGQAVDPRTYVLQDGDHIRIVVRTG